MYHDIDGALERSLSKHGERYVEENVKANVIQNDLDIEDDRVAVYEGMNSDSEKDFKTTYKASNEDEDGDMGVEAAAENVVVHPAVSQPMNVPPFMRNFNLNAIMVHLLSIIL
ncbi:hypothetical protein AHAS_Ahas03G0130600 [Arachis hypogaea]